MISKEDTNIQTKYKSLFHVVNETRTPLGERFLRSVLSSPYTDPKKLNEIYDVTEKMRNAKISDELNLYLAEIRDIERLGRRMELRMIKPYEFCMFITSYENIIKTYELLEKNKDLKTLLPKDNFIKNVRKIIDNVNNMFDLEKLGLCNDINFDERLCIYNKGIHKDIDDLNDKIHSGKKTVEELSRILAGLLTKKNEKKEEKQDQDETVEIKNTKKDGNYIFLSVKNGKIITDLIAESDMIELDKEKIKVSDIKIENSKSGCKIIVPSIKKSANLFKLKNKIIEMLEESPEKDEEKGACLQIKNNSQDGYFMSLTATRANTLKAILDKKENAVIDLGYKKIKSSELEFKIAKNTAKILVPNLNEHADKLEEYVKEISDLYKLHYLDDIEMIYEKFADIFMKCNEFVTKVDYTNSNTVMSLKYGYCKPQIMEKSYGYVNAKQMRHPIVERIIDFEYVPHDICIGDDNLKGMLIYGLNSSGKSVLMKQVAISVIMAQSGMYVPASKYEYSPYHCLMTRISGSDNLFKGQSSFAVELTEINSILKRSNERTLIVGDEVFKGTEGTSATALVASTIIKLSKLKPTFIFTTHLHNIVSLDIIKSIPNIKAFHLKVSYDTKNDILVYDRKLSPGSGDSDYGVLVAKFIIKDKDFIDCATSIKNTLLDNHDNLISGKKSKYNGDIYVYECSVCHGKGDLETHHINFQQSCDENNVVIDKKHIKKNDKCNLIVLCDKCHDKIHNNEMKITGKIQTTKGKQLTKK